MKELKGWAKENKNYMFIVAALIAMVSFMLVIGFTLVFFLFLILWLLFFFVYLRATIKLNFGVWVVVFIVLWFLTVIFIGQGGKSSSSTATTSTGKKLSAVECKPLIDKYNNKVLKVSSDGLIGTIGIKVTPECKLTGRYIFAFTANLTENPIPELAAISSYFNYVSNLHETSQTDRGHYGVGAVSVVKRNAMALPDPFATSQEVSVFYRDPADGVPGRGSSFYWSYEKTGDFSQNRYQEMLGNNVFEVVDGLPYMQKTAYPDGTYSYSIDSEKAEKDGKIANTFNLTISE